MDSRQASRRAPSGRAGGRRAVPGPVSGVVPLPRSRAWPACLPTWLVVAAFVAALCPLWLGPALTPLRIAAENAHHLCACGMDPGTCGCPECEQLERSRGGPPHESGCPALSGECKSGRSALGDAHVPPVVLVAALCQGAPRLVALASALALAKSSSLPITGPPKPPPRVPTTFA